MEGIRQDLEMLGLRKGYVDDSLIVQNSPFGIVVINFHGIVLSWNPMATEILGWQIEEVLGKPIPFLPKNKMRELPIFCKMFYNGLMVVTRNDGKKVEISLSGGPIRKKDCGVLFISKR